MVLERHILDKISKEKSIHRRYLDLNSYEVDTDRILVEGRLKDERFRPMYDVGGEVREAGIIHDMCIRLLVQIDLPPLILEAEAEMNHYPHELCPATIESIKQVIGMKVKTGFGLSIRRLMGGVKGCAHLTHLLIVMGQEIFAGTMTTRLSKPQPVPCSFDDIKGLDYLVNSCWVWREDGPLVQRLKEVVSAQACNK